MLAGQRIQRVAAVGNGANHTRDPVGDTGMRPDLAGIVGYSVLGRVPREIDVTGMEHEETCPSGFG